MLRFAQKPDTIFTAILTRTFEDAIGFLQELIEEREVYADYYPLAAKIYNAEQAQTLLTQLLEAHLSPDLWEINDFHFCLIYDALKDFCVAQNEISEESGGPIMEFGENRIFRLDHAKMVGLFFYNSDFTIEPSVLDGMSDQKKVGPEAYAVIMGVKPGKEALKLKKSQETGPFVPLDPAPGVYRSGSTQYPS